jgi:hypothetical protein
VLVSTRRRNQLAERLKTGCRQLDAGAFEQRVEGVGTLRRRGAEVPIPLQSFEESLRVSDIVPTRAVQAVHRFEVQRSPPVTIGDRGRGAGFSDR